MHYFMYTLSNIKLANAISNCKPYVSIHHIITSISVNTSRYIILWLRYISHDIL